MKTIAIRPAASRLLYVALALGLGRVCLPQAVGQIDTGSVNTSCLPGERGYLRASLRGAIESELDWRGVRLQCEGGARPDGRGLRVSFLGPADASGHRLRLVFGIAATPGTARTAAAATNVTVIVEGEQRVYARIAVGCGVRERNIANVR